MFDGDRRSLSTAARGGLTGVALAAILGGSLAATLLPLAKDQKCATQRTYTETQPDKLNPKATDFPSACMQTVTEYAYSVAAQKGGEQWENQQAFFKIALNRVWIWLRPALKDLKVTDVLIAMFTGLLWLVTFDLSKSTKRLWDETKRLAIGAEAQSADFKESLKIAASAAKATNRYADAFDRRVNDVERAYVFGGIGSITPTPETGNATIGLSVSNNGKTPARVKKYVVGTRQAPLPYESDYSNAIEIETDTIVGAGKNRIIFNVVGCSNIGIFFGYFEYVDIFKKGHKSKFCISYNLETEIFNSAGSPDWNEYD